MLIPTGQELSQRPSTAQVSSTPYVDSSDNSLKSAESPFNLAADKALRITMRCLGVVVKSLLGQIGSQYPHSTQESATASIGGLNLML